MLSTSRAATRARHRTKEILLTTGASYAPKPKLHRDCVHKTRKTLAQPLAKHHPLDTKRRPITQPLNQRHAIHRKRDPLTDGVIPSTLCLLTVRATRTSRQTHEALAREISGGPLMQAMPASPVFHPLIYPPLINPLIYPLICDLASGNFIR